MRLDRSKRFFVGLRFRQRGAIGIAKTRVETIRQHDDRFASLSFLLQLSQRILQRFVKMSLTGAVRNLDCIRRLLTIGGKPINDLTSC
jgi:hypothetical protein